MTITEDNIFISDYHKPISFDGISSLGEFFINKLTREHATATVLIDFSSGRQWTGQQLAARILEVATTLAEDYGFERGTCVCISYDNCDWTLILGLAVVAAGGLVAGAYNKDPYAELLYQARKVRPKFLFCHQANLAWGPQLERDLGYPVVAMAVDSADFEEDFMVRRRDFPMDRLRPPVACKDLETEVAFITMSSGTTGRPKAVPTTHKNCLAELLSAPAKPTRLRRASSASFDYVSGRLSILYMLLSGDLLVAQRDFEPKTYLEAIERFQLDSVSLGVAPLYRLITSEHLKSYNLSSVKRLTVAGAKMVYLERMREFFAKYPHIQLVGQYYGTSEISLCSAKLCTPQQYLEQPDCCGKLTAPMRAKIVCCETGQLLGKNSVGSLRASGPTVFPGYYDLSACETSRTFLSDSSVHDEQGYYITGDLAYFDHNEELYIVGREKELMSCRAAKKVVPQELEETISEHPAVANVCVLGVPHQHEPSLHCPRAFVQLKRECYGGDFEKFISVENGSSMKEKLEHSGNRDTKLCSLSESKRRRLAESIMRYVEERVGWEKQLTGGLVLLDSLATLRATGKWDKRQLAALTREQVEIYGDRSGEKDH